MRISWRERVRTVLVMGQASGSHGPSDGPGVGRANAHRPGGTGPPGPGGGTTAGRVDCQLRVNYGMLTARLWLPHCMTVLVTRRHVDYARVTTTACPAVS
ncbi:hypothetical protein GCM10010326_38940 [Streptomyces xanthochromogenes]|uniref:Uncharacterized protein n=1 Tax=Streptomyces xanthochromogenes TaxID=67384 RepID=A0ABQ3A987_9ACTN|nr:hypothetical protein GCM10010326_38940 [Streptomyces xanthochromogenes]